MKILKLLNKKNLSIIFFLFFGIVSNAEEQPVDIWNIDNKKSENNSTESSSTSESNLKIETNSVSDIFKMQSEKKIDVVELDENSINDKSKIYGLYDPEDYGLDIYMWSNSDGDHLKNIFKKLNKINLSKDANEIVKISMLTNSYLPKKNISEKNFLKFRSDWLIKNAEMDLIKEYLIKNQIFDIHSDLTKYLVNHYLSEANVKESCKIFSKNLKHIENEYLSKFNIYCLINEGKKDEAQLIFDLKKELGFRDKYFEDKINYLLGYNSKVKNSVSEKTILDFHLAHKVNSDFSYQAKDSTKKIIWKYLYSSNLLDTYEKIDTSELDKISTLEKATHNKNYPEKNLLDIYKQFQFNINQLLNAKKNYKSLSNIEARALIYQKILLESEMIEKLKLLKLLKSSFKKDNIGDAFDVELKKYLEKIDPMDVPDNLTSFYYTNIKIKKKTDNTIKFNNDILHQSKLINYFNGDYSKSKIEKDVNNYLKKIKKNKKYFFSKKDQIFIESLKHDGINISEKYNDLYEINDTEIPSDIQIMINNNEKGLALLRIAEVIGQDELERIDEDTIYFIIRTLNQLDIGKIRNQILLKVLPLKV